METMNDIKDAIVETETLPTLDEVSEELDTLLIRQLELIQEYIDLSRDSEVHQKEGYLNLAKSRYIQGSNSISQSRLPTEDSDEYSAVITANRNTDDTKPLGNSAIPTPTRRTISKDTDAAAEAKLLRQFGVLSSGSVKAAQKGFRKCTEICIDRINVTEELLCIQKRFNELHKLKTKIVTFSAQETQP